MASRFVFMFLASPAACVAVASGTALLFVSDVRHPWMLAKLGGVGLLAFCHYRFGSLLTRLDDRTEELPVVRLALLSGFSALAALGVLWLVLAKPDFGGRQLPVWMTEPSGVLRDRLPADRSE